MIVINDVNESTFSINGIVYTRNFTGIVLGNLIKIVNVYDSIFILREYTHYSDFLINGSSYASSALVQEQLSGILFVRDLAPLELAIANKLDSYLLGIPNGIAELDTQGFVVNTQLPSYVDDVLEFANFASLPSIGESGKIYITIDDNLTYRWSGSVYATISSTIALGETSTTAYRGDRGKIAYDHSQLTHDKTFIGLGNVDNTSDANKPVSTAQQTALNLKVDKVTGSSLLSDTEITRLLGLSNYTHPTTHPPSIITQDPSNRFVTDTEKSTWNGKQSALSGTGFVKISGTTISYDNSTYSLSSHTHDYSSIFAPTGHTHDYSSVYLGLNAKASDSELLDGLDSSSFIRQVSYANVDEVLTGVVPNHSLTYVNAPNGDWGNVITFGAPVGKYATQLFGKIYSNVLMYRSIDNGVAASWKTLVDSVNVGTYAIQNQQASAQTANMWISGSGRFDSTIQATTAKLTNLTDGYLPYHISDASGLGNSAIYTNGVSVGIGTTSPLAKLHLGGSDILYTPIGDIVMSRYSASVTDTRASSVFHYFDGSIDRMVFGVSGDGGSNNFNKPNQIALAKMVIGADGNVGIGYSSGTEITNNKLAVNGSGYFNGSVTSEYTGETFRSVAATGGAKSLRLTNTGGTVYFGIEDSAGTFFGAPAYDTVIYSPANNLKIHTPAATFSGSVTAGGEVTAYSDARLKNVICSTESVLDRLMKINIVDYRRNDIDTEKVRTGVIAQELRKLFPQYVSGNEDEGMLSVNYAELVSICIKAIQELKNG